MRIDVRRQIGVNDDEGCREHPQLKRGVANWSGWQNWALPKLFLETRQDGTLVVCAASRGLRRGEEFSQVAAAEAELQA